MLENSAAGVIYGLWSKIGEKQCKSGSFCARLFGLKFTFQGMAMDAVSLLHGNCPEISDGKEVIFLDGSSVVITMEGNSIKGIREEKKATVEVVEKNFVKTLEFFADKVSKPVNIC